MTDTISCQDCRFFKEPKEPHMLGKCKYPMPPWVWCRSAGSDYVYGAEAKDCPVFEDVLGRGIKE